jgi:hypothetical protein
MQLTVRGHLVLQQGLLFGVVLGVIDLLRTLIDGPSGLTAPLSGALGVIAFLIVAVGFVYLGFRVAARTTHVRSSALAGLIAGLVVWACYVVGTMLVALPNQDTLRRQFQAAADQSHLGIQYTNAAVIGALVFSLVLAVFLGAGVGAALGALGGVVGKRQVVQTA